MGDGKRLEGQGFMSVFGERKWITQVAAPRSTGKAKGNHWGIAEQYAVCVGEHYCVSAPQIFSRHFPVLIPNVTSWPGVREKGKEHFTKHTASGWATAGTLA